jgi:hypothetical protein
VIPVICQFARYYYRSISSSATRLGRDECTCPRGPNISGADFVSTETQPTERRLHRTARRRQSIVTTKAQANKVVAAVARSTGPHRPPPREADRNSKSTAASLQNLTAPPGPQPCHRRQLQGRVCSIAPNRSFITPPPAHPFRASPRAPALGPPRRVGLPLRRGSETLGPGVRGFRCLGP